MVGTRELTALILAGLIGSSVHAGSFETKAVLDGAGRWTFTGLYRAGAWSGSFNCRLDPLRQAGVLFGINGPFLSIGHLGDSGLAAENRNPGYDALPRLMEKTRYSADLRSVSTSRLGTALFLPGNRLGIVVDKRDNEEYLLIWAALPIGSALLLESVVQLASPEPDPGDESWYVDDPGSPGGRHLNPAVRVKGSCNRWTFGLTFLGSLGTELIPGAAAALAAGWVQGPWRFRIRTGAASCSYRTADGDRLGSSTGLAFDIRFRPAAGFQFACDFSAGRLRSGDPSIDEGRLALGWARAGWLVYGESVWSGTGIGPDHIRMEASWRNRQHFTVLTGKLSPGGQISLEAESELRPGGNLTVKSGLGVTFGPEERPAWNTGLRWTFRLNRNRLIVAVDFNDIPESWKGGPSTVGAGECSIRWIHSFSD